MAPTQLIAIILLSNILYTSAHRFRPKMATNGSTMCATDDKFYSIPSVTYGVGIPYGVPLAVQCAYSCNRQPNGINGCSGFNVQNSMTSDVQCLFFASIPTNYNYIVGCSYYQRVDQTISVDSTTAAQSSSKPQITSAPPSSSNNSMTHLHLSIILSYVIIGCYADQNNPHRDLPYIPTYLYNNNTQEYCIDHCFKSNYRYAGVQYGYYCCCGDSYGSHGTSNACNTPCSGNSSQICGGMLANTIIYTGLQFSVVVLIISPMAILIASSSSSS